MTGYSPSNRAGAVPWYMFDLTNRQLITTKYVPSDIRDVKSIIIAEVPIPGLNYQPIVPGGGGNRKVSFTLPLVYKLQDLGNIGIVKQFDQLRNRSSFSVLGRPSVQFDSNPKVLYFWGTGSVPLEYFVTKCDFVHKQGWVNARGRPQYTELEIELTLDEQSPTYAMEELYRAVTSLVGIGQGVLS